MWCRGKECACSRCSGSGTEGAKSLRRECVCLRVNCKEYKACAMGERGEGGGSWRDVCGRHVGKELNWGCGGGGLEEGIHVPEYTFWTTSLCTLLVKREFVGEGRGE